MENEIRVMEWGRLICDKRLGMEEYHDERHHTRPISSATMTG